MERSAARSTYGKDTVYHAHVKHPDFKNMFTTTDVAEHDEIKAKLLGPYSGRTTRGMEPMYVASEPGVSLMLQCYYLPTSEPYYLPSCWLGPLRLGNMNF